MGPFWESLGSSLIIWRIDRFDEVRILPARTTISVRSDAPKELAPGILKLSRKETCLGHCLKGWAQGSPASVGPPWGSQNLSF